jgi:hypothetical protein
MSKLSLMQESLLRQAGNTILMYGGAIAGVKVRASPIKCFMTPRRTGKSWTQMQLLKERPEGKVGAINFYFDDLWYKQTKFLRSSSKQSRMIKVFINKFN